MEANRPGAGPGAGDDGGGGFGGINNNGGGEYKQGGGDKENAVPNSIDSSNSFGSGGATGTVDDVVLPVSKLKTMEQIDEQIQTVGFVLDGIQFRINAAREKSHKECKEINSEQDGTDEKATSCRVRCDKIQQTLTDEILHSLKDKQRKFQGQLAELTDRREKLNEELRGLEVHEDMTNTVHVSNSQRASTLANAGQGTFPAAGRAGIPPRLNGSPRNHTAPHASTSQWKLAYPRHTGTPGSNGVALGAAVADIPASKLTTQGKNHGRKRGTTSGGSSVLHTGHYMPAGSGCVSLGALPKEASESKPAAQKKRRVTYSKKAGSTGGGANVRNTGNFKTLEKLAPGTVYFPCIGGCKRVSPLMNAPGVVAKLDLLQKDEKNRQAVDLHSFKHPPGLSDVPSYVSSKIHTKKCVDESGETLPVCFMTKAEKKRLDKEAYRLANL